MEPGGGASEAWGRRGPALSSQEHRWGEGMDLPSLVVDWTRHYGGLVPLLNVKNLRSPRVRCCPGAQGRRHGERGPAGTLAVG